LSPHRFDLKEGRATVSTRHEAVDMALHHPGLGDVATPALGSSAPAAVEAASCAGNSTMIRRIAS
jgi:hypothetical protein